MQLPGLAARIAAASSERQRAVARAVVTEAAGARPVDDPRYERAAQALERKQYGDPGGLREMMALVADLDDEQWRCQEAVDRGDAAMHEYVAAFERARAANSLLCALDADARWAALEASYEALAALDEDEHTLKRVVEIALVADREP